MKTSPTMLGLFMATLVRRTWSQSGSMHLAASRELLGMGGKELVGETSNGPALPRIESQPG
jgi:hypothetical protein